MKNDSEDAKRAAKLAIAIQELTLQNENKDKQAAELLVANKDLQKADEKIIKASNLYAFISQVNQKIVRVKDEATLFSNACNIALKFGKFKMTWIGVFDDAQKKIAVVEKCGIPEEEVTLLTDTPWQSMGPQDYVLRNDTYYICNDIENDPEADNWRPFAARHGIRSYMVLPIKKSGIITGTFNLYSTEPDFAGTEEIKLLVEVTGDISFALDLFEREKQQKEAEEKIKAGEILYHSLFENMLEGFAHCKMIYENDIPQDFIYIEVNESFEKLTGLKNVVGKNATEVLAGIKDDIRELFETYGRVALTGKSERFEVYMESLKKWLAISVYSIEKGYFTVVFEEITEKKLYEEKLANSEKRFRVLIEKSTDMKSLTTETGKVLYGSPSIKKELGYNTDEFLHIYPYQLIHPEDIKGYLEKREQLLQVPGKSFNFEQRRLHKNGTWIWCEGSITNLLHEPGVNALVTNFRNVSDRKKSDQQQEFSKNNLSALINNTTDLMWSVDRDFKLITANQAFNGIMTTAFGQIISPGTSVFSVPYPREVLDHFKQLYEKAFAGKSFIEIEHFVVPNESWLEVSYYPIRKGDEIIGTACHSRDITKSKKAEETSLRLALIVESSRDAIVGLSLEGLIMSWNRAAEILYDYPSAEVIGKPYAILLHPEGAAEFAKKVERLTAGEQLGHFELEHIQKSGRLVCISLSISPIKDSNGKLTGVSANAHDISEQKRAEEMLTHATNTERARSGKRIAVELVICLILSIVFFYISDTYNLPEKFIYKIGDPESSILDDLVLLMAFISVLGIVFGFRRFFEMRKGGQAIQNALRTLTGELEMRVQERTNDLSRSNEVLLNEITERKKAETNLLQSEARLNEAQSIAHIGNWEVDLTTGVSIWSNEFYKIFGIEQGSVTPSTETFLSLLDPEDLKYANENVAEARKNQQDSNFYSRTNPVNGRIKYLYTERRFEFDRNRKAIRMYGITQDITERKEAEEKLKQNEIRFREFFDSAPESIVVIDIDSMTFSKFNNNALKLLKYSAEELIKKGPVDTSPPFQPDGRSTAEKAMELITEAMKGGHPVFEWLLLDGNGKEIISEVRLAALTNIDGPQVIANFADITERKLAEQKLKALYERLLFHMENSPLGFIEWDGQVRIRSMSKQAEEILGWSEKEFTTIRKDGPSIVYIEDLPLVLELNRQLLSGEVERNSVQHRNYTKDGRVIWCEWFNSAMKDRDGKVDTILSLVQDITERKKAENEILELNEHLEKRVDERTNELLEANKALEAFSYSVSHDLRSPVRSVMGFAKLIKKDHGAGLNENAKELFSHIEESGKRMNAIIDDLLNFAKWGKEKLRLTEVDMTALFRHVWKNTLQESPHHAILELQPLPKMQADKPMIRQVIINLISNAVKYSSKKEKPVIKVGFEEKEEEVIFHVSDNGAGFDMVHYNRLFGAFQRLHGMSDFEGTGIGLTLIKTIIEKHRGRVWAEGKEGVGATFWFSLPKISGKPAPLPGV